MIVLAKLVTVYDNDKKMLMSSFLYILFLFITNKPCRLLFKYEVKSL